MKIKVNFNESPTLIPVSFKPIDIDILTNFVEESTVLNVEFIPQKESIQVDLKETSSALLLADFGEYRVIHTGGQPYEGEYEVIPKAFIQQILPTKSKLLENNVTVKEIPVYEVSNLYGTTINIGG